MAPIAVGTKRSPEPGEGPDPGAAGATLRCRVPGGPYAFPGRVVFVWVGRGCAGVTGVSLARGGPGGSGGATGCGGGHPELLTASRPPQRVCAHRCVPVPGRVHLRPHRGVLMHRGLRTRQFFTSFPVPAPVPGSSSGSHWLQPPVPLPVPGNSSSSRYQLRDLVAAPVPSTVSGSRYRL